MPSLSCPSHLQGRHPPPHAAPSLSAKSLFFFFPPSEFYSRATAAMGLTTVLFACTNCMNYLKRAGVRRMG